MQRDNFNSQNGPIPMVMNRWNRFFVESSGTTLGGAFSNTLIDDQQKRRNSGLLVAIIVTTSGLLASISWSIPWGIYGIIVGPVWFAIMMWTERSILQQMDAAAAKKIAEKWMSATASVANIKATVGFGWLFLRLIMIMFISYFNSEMIRVLMFKPEIVAEIKIRQNSETQKIADSITAIRKTIEEKYSVKEKELVNAQSTLDVMNQDYDMRIAALGDSLNFWNSKLVYEVKGPGGISGKTGDGKVAGTIRSTIATFQKQKDDLIAERDHAQSYSGQVSSLTSAQKQLDQAKATRKTEMDKLDKRQAELVKQVMDRPVNGLSFMLTVLNDIAHRNILIWIVFAMFFFIEAIPVFLKFFSDPDSFVYERAAEHLEMIQGTSDRAREAVKKMRQRDSAL